MKKVVKAVLVGASLASLVGCSSVPMKVGGVDPNRKYDVIGKGTATAHSAMIINCIPVRYNDKVARAYHAAVAQKNGDALINTTITERWYWIYVGNSYKTTVEGDVIKYK